MKLIYSFEILIFASSYSFLSLSTTTDVKGISLIEPHPCPIDLMN